MGNVGFDDTQTAGEYAQKDENHTAQPMLIDGTVVEEGQPISLSEVERASQIAQEQQEQKTQTENGRPDNIDKQSNP